MRANSLALRLFLSATAWTVVILLVTGIAQELVAAVITTRPIAPGEARTRPSQPRAPTPIVSG